MNPSGCALVLALLLATIAAGGCGDTNDPTADPSHLTGEWSLSYVAVDSTPCSVPGLVQGCGGVGTLDLIQQGAEVTGTYSARGGCQTCGEAWDFGGSGSVRSWSWTDLEFSLNDCEFRAELPPGRADAITGTVVCGLGSDRVVSGSFQMTRSP